MANLRCLSLTASRFFGGPERQLLGLAIAGRPHFHTTVASFSEDGLCREFLARVRNAGIDAIELRSDMPHLWRARSELVELLKRQQIDVLFVHGYKAGLIGWLAARRVGIPVVAVSRGWTHESRKIRMYEWLDRKMLRRMDRVVCVSRSQADKVRRCGVRPDRIVVIPNAIDTSRFAKIDPAGRDELLAMFPEPRPSFLIGAAGRLSPEKGFDLLIAAAAQVLAAHPHVGFLLFGDGPLHGQFRQQIEHTSVAAVVPDAAPPLTDAANVAAAVPDAALRPSLPPDARHSPVTCATAPLPSLSHRFLLPGFRPDFDRLLPHLDLFVQSSHTEGMPNVILEAVAARVPVVATDVGGTRELLESVPTAKLINANAVSELVTATIAQIVDRRQGESAAKNESSAFDDRFSFAAQSASYHTLVRELTLPTYWPAQQLNAPEMARRTLS